MNTKKILYVLLVCARNEVNSRPKKPKLLMPNVRTYARCAPKRRFVEWRASCEFMVGETIYFTEDIFNIWRMHDSIFCHKNQCRWNFAPFQTMQENCVKRQIVVQRIVEEGFLFHFNWSRIEAWSYVRVRMFLHTAGTQLLNESYNSHTIEIRNSIHQKKNGLAGRASKVNE